MKRQKRLTEAYYYSLTRFALTDYMLCESTEERERFPEEFKAIEKELKKTISSFLRKVNLIRAGQQESGFPEGPEEALSDVMAVEALRERIICVSEQVLFFMDNIKTHEYALSRQAGRFSPQKAGGLSDVDLTERLMEYILDGGIPAVISEKIQQVIGELPVHFTKLKFYSLIENSMKSCINAPERNFLENLSSIKSAANLTAAFRNPPPEYETAFEKLYDLCRQLEQTDYQSMSKELCEIQQAKIDESMEEALFCSDFLLTFIELVNCLYAAMLALPEAEELPVEKTLVNLISGLLEEDCQENPEFLEYLEELEGSQEYYGELYLRKAGKRDSSSDRALRECLDKIDLLLSSDQMTRFFCDDEILTESCFREEMDRLFDELSERFAGCGKIMKRSLMARVLSNLPMWFRSMDELRQFILESLEGCIDPTEKAICMNRLDELMVFEDALV